MAIKDHPENSPEGRETKRRNQAADPSLAEAQRLADEANRKGYIGVEADPTPDDHYTLAGVTAGKPTPETDRGQFTKVREYQETELAEKTEGVAGRSDS